MTTTTKTLWERLLFGSGILLMYGITFFILMLVLFLKLNYTVEGIGYDWIIGINLLIFVAYDLRFRFYKKDNWVSIGRSKSVTLASIRAACQYISYFIAFLAIGFTLFSDKEIGENLAYTYVFKSSLLMLYALMILTFSAISLLFVPVPYTDKEQYAHRREPSKVLKNCFTTVLLMQKIIITLTIYFVLLFLVMKYKAM